MDRRQPSSSRLSTEKNIQPQRRQVFNPQTVNIVLGPGATNTHFFDGKLTNSFYSMLSECTRTKIQEELDRSSKIDKEEKSKAFRKLEEFVKTLPSNQVTPNAKRCLRVIVQTHDIHGHSAVPGNQNYSHSDKLFACDLLYLLCEKIIEENSSEHLNLTLSQLDEMASGLCSQGRCNRLFQIYVMLRDDLTPTSSNID